MKLSQKTALAFRHSNSVFFVAAQLSGELHCSCRTENVVRSNPHKVAHKFCLLPQFDDGVQRHVDEYAVALLSGHCVLKRAVVYVIAQETASIAAYFHSRVPFFM